MGRLKNPSALPFAALHHPPWDYGIVFALRRDTAVAPGGGRSSCSCTHPSGWPIEGGDYSDVYTWLDPQRTRYGFSYGSPWSPAGLTHALGAIASHADRLWCGCCTGGVVVVIIVYWGSPPSSNIRPHGRSQTSTTYTLINAVPGYERPRQLASLSSKPGTGGPKSWPTATPVRRVRRLIRLRREFSLQRIRPGAGTVMRRSICLRREFF